MNAVVETPPTAANACDLRAAFAREAAVPLMPYQREAIRSPQRFTWNNWSRQTGKSFTFTLRRILRGLARRRTQLFLSAGQRQSRELMARVRYHCDLLGIACEIRNCRDFSLGTLITRLEAYLPNGVRIIAIPANPLTARGYTADVFLDEFAMHRDDRAVWAALFPALLRGDGELDVASTPRGRGNMFFRLKSNAVFAHVTVTLPEAVAAGLHLNEADIRAAMDDERLFRQEFMCEFDDDADAFLTHELILACVDPALTKSLDTARLEERKVEAYAGVDVGRKRDLTVIWLWERSGQEFATRGVIELDNMPFAEQQAVIERILRRRSVRRICIDATGVGMALAEHVTRQFGDHRVEAVTFTPAVQSDLASRLRILAEQRRLRIPSDPTIHNDWHSLQRITTPSGHLRYRAERSASGHADRFWAAALGLYAGAETFSTEADCVFTSPLNFARSGTW